MSRRLRAERLAQADLARPLADHHQHDVHDDDAADDEREADDADQNREDAGRHLVVEVRGTCPTSGRRSCRAPSAAGGARPAARRARRPSACGTTTGRVGRTVSCSDWRDAEDPLEGAERDHRRTRPATGRSIDALLVAPRPTTRKCTPASVIILSSGSSVPNSRSAVSHPRTATRRPASNSPGVIGAAALDDRRGQVVVLAA